MKKNWKLWILLLVLLAFSALKAYAQSDSLLLTVDELFRLGMENELRLQADRIGEQQAAAQSRTARTARLPEIEIGLRGGFVGQPVFFERGLSSPTYPESPDWEQNYAVNLTQPLYEGGRIRHAIRGADIRRRIASLQTETDEADTKLSLIRHYLDLFNSYEQRKVLLRNIEESERRLKDIRQLKEQGVITNNDVLRSEVRLTDDRLSLRETENTVALRSQQLCIVLGLNEELRIVPDTALLNIAMHIEPYPYYVETAYGNDPSMRLLQARTQLADNEVKLAKAEYMPTVSLYAANTLARPVQRTLADMYNNSWNIGVSFSYPLSSLYKNKHRVSNARLEVERSKNAEMQKQQEIRMNVREAWLRHGEAKERVEALELSVRQARENYRIMESRYLGQLAILTDLLDANNVLLDAELRLTAARVEVIYTYYELQRACGRI